MSSMSLDGLVSGLSTSSLIQQLMQVEAAPQTALRTKVTSQQKTITAYQSVNTKMSGLLSAAKALGSTDTWTSMKATSSSDAVAVSAKPGASSGSLTFKVDKLAATQTVIFGGRVTSLTDPAQSVLTGPKLNILMADGTTKELTPTDGSLQNVVKSINDTAGAAYKAAAIQVEPGKYTLQLTATASGATSPFASKFADVDATNDVPAELNIGAAAVLTQGADAELTVGTTSTFKMTSTSNTFTDVLPGVSITAAKVQGAADQAVTVTVGVDKEGIASKVKTMVDAANAALGDMKAQSLPKNGNVPAGPLAGDNLLRQLSSDILATVAGGVSSVGSLSSVGVQLDKGGTLVFDKDKFLTAFDADPVKTQKFFDSYDNKDATGTLVPARASAAFDVGWDKAVGLGRKLEELAARASEGLILPSDSVDKVKEGLLPGVIKRKNSFIDDLNDQIQTWDTRLASREAALKKQFTGLETALGKMKQQSSWLAGQIASLG